MPSPLIPPATSSAALDAVVKRVKEHAAAYARMPVRARRELCDQICGAYRRIAEPSVLAACRAKGIPEGSELEGEEWLNGPVLVVRALRLTSQKLGDIAQYGVPQIAAEHLSELPDGRLCAELYPADLLEAALLPRHHGAVHFQPGVTRENLAQHQASFYKKPHGGRLCAVLGGGNVNSIPPLDVIHKLFVEGTVCILKMNPVNAYLGPFLEEAFRAAGDAGFFAVVYGGTEQGMQLVEHALVDEVHLTGSDATHDAVVWGPPGPDREARKERNDPLLKKEVTAELGNITPVIIVPGPYEDSELKFQAANVAGMVANNASFNCNSAKLLVTARDGSERTPFLAALEAKLGQTTVRQAYYPGAADRFQSFIKDRSGVKLLGTPGPGELPYGVLRDIDPDATDDRVFRQEPWCSLISETALPGRSEEFLERAVAFLNTRVWGSLCAAIIVHPRTLEEPAMKDAVERAIRELKYGSVSLNTWPAAVYGLGSLPWGAHPSSTRADIQSGSGFVHNPYMLDGVEKSVLRAPPILFPPPLWMPGHRSLRGLTRRLVDFEDRPSWLKLPGLALDGVRG